MRTDDARCGRCDQEVPDNGDIVCVDCLKANEAALRAIIAEMRERAESVLDVAYNASTRRAALDEAHTLRIFADRLAALLPKDI